MTSPAKNEPSKEKVWIHLYTTMGNGACSPPGPQCETVPDSPFMRVRDAPP